MTPHATTEPFLFPRPQRVAAGVRGLPRGVLERVSARIDPVAVPRPQGYRLVLDAAGVTITGHNAAGVFYARQTLAQIGAAAGETVDGLTVDDWPDLLVRGYMLDVSRDRVPQRGVLKQRIERLARLKINQLQLYTEHTLAFAGHEAVWRDASPLTFDDWADIERFCNARFIDLVPCQNVFGHMHRWLVCPRYRDLAECPDGFDTPWGFRDPNPFSLDPSDPGSFALSADLIDQLCAASGSGFFNIGCDETVDLGQGKNRARVAREGRASVYLEYLQKLCARVSERGKTPMFWGDIVLDHSELVDQVPRDAVLLNWGYEAGHDFDGQGARFRAAGVRYHVCPGTSAWCSLTGRVRNALDNLRGAAEAAGAHGAEGYVITDWGDWGHWQPSSVSWPGLCYGAAVAWALDANRDEGPLARAVSAVGVDEPEGDTLGRLLLRLGDVYLHGGPRPMNNTWWFRLLRCPDLPEDAKLMRQVGVDDARRALAELDAVAAGLEAYAPVSDEARWLAHETAWAVAMTRWACARGEEVAAALAGGSVPPRVDGGPQGAAELLTLVDRFRGIWHGRSRPGGLEDSVAKLTRVLDPAGAGPRGSF